MARKFSNVELVSPDGKRTVTATSPAEETALRYDGYLEEGQAKLTPKTSAKAAAAKSAPKQEEEFKGEASSEENSDDNAPAEESPAKPAVRQAAKEKTVGTNPS